VIKLLDRYDGVSSGSSESMAEEIQMNGAERQILQTNFQQPLTNPVWPSNQFINISHLTMGELPSKEIVI
jgi:hypothetical protein